MSVLVATSAPDVGDEIWQWKRIGSIYSKPQTTNGTGVSRQHRKMRLPPSRNRDTWYFHFWRAEDIPSWSAGYGFTPDEIPGTLVFGDDGADEALVMDLREERSDRRYPIYAINYYSVEWKLAVPVAPNFRSLLQLGHSLLSSDDE